MASGKPRCAISGCSKLAQLLTGKCHWCGKKFCASHRLPENHDCDFLEDMKIEEYDRNGEKLMGGRTGRNQGR